MDDEKPDRIWVCARDLTDGTPSNEIHWYDFDPSPGYWDEYVPAERAQEAEGQLVAAVQAWSISFTECTRQIDALKTERDALREALTDVERRLVNMQPHIGSLMDYTRQAGFIDNHVDALLDVVRAAITKEPQDA